MVPFGAFVAAFVLAVAFGAICGRLLSDKGRLTRENAALRAELADLKASIRPIPPKGGSGTAPPPGPSATARPRTVP